MSMDKTFSARLGDRSLFPDLSRRVYFNHGSISPPSLAVLRTRPDDCYTGTPCRGN